MKPAELRDKSVDELRETLLEQRREQMNLRMQLATGQLAQNHQIRKVRRDIARIKTILGEKSRASDSKGDAA